MLPGGLDGKESTCNAGDPSLMEKMLDIISVFLNFIETCF